MKNALCSVFEQLAQRQQDIYNGQRRWTAARSIEALITPPPGGLGRYQPHFHYHVFDMGRVALGGRKGVVADLVRLERSPSPYDVKDILEGLAERIAAPEHDSLRRAITVWLNRSIFPRMMPGQPVPVLTDLKEVKTMLAERVETWVETWKRQGLQEGRQKILRAGRAELLQRLLERRHGPLPTWAKERIAAAELPQLDAWADRLFDAETLDAVFNQG